MTVGYSGVSNQANTTAGYALGVSAANVGTQVGFGVSGTGVVDDYSGFVPSVPYYLLLETSGYLVQETGASPNNRFELE
jgi:hypothetical protein